MEEDLSPEDWAIRAVTVQGMRQKRLPRTSHTVALCMRRAPNAAGKLMPEWEDMCACACAVQNMHLMATSLGVACAPSDLANNLKSLNPEALNPASERCRTCISCPLASPALAINR